MNAVYNQLITETFCDNAIRSVMMIDDEYTPYHKLVEVSNEADDLEKIKEVLKESKRASAIQKFFENKKFICDVSDGLETFDPEKARKSDLLILDYQLKNDSPDLSLSILKTLSKTKHMNLVVVYTNEDLKNVWLEIAASMQGLGNLDVEEEYVKPEFKDKWLELTEGGDEIPEEWNKYIDNDVAQFMKGEDIDYKKIKNISKDDRKYTKDICESTLAMMAQEFDKLNESYEKVDIKGSFNGNLWLKFGNVFVTLHQKSAQDTAEDLWESLTDSLIDWQPNYFRLISSEIQNQIENGAVTLNQYLDKDYNSQAAWLWQVLKNWDNKELELKKLLENNTDSIKDDIIFSDDVMDFAQKVCGQLIPDFPLATNDKENKATEQIKYVLKHSSKSINVKDQGLPIKVAHALNCSLSTKDFLSPYVTTGTLLHCSKDDGWLLCVTPACDTVPEQNNSCMSKRLAPNFKLLKFIRLEKIKGSSALSKATDGLYLFIEDGIVLRTSSNPNLEYAITHNNKEQAKSLIFDLITFESKSNKNSGDSEKTEQSSLSLSEDQVIPHTKSYKVKAQLKDSYAARFQALASHHVGRIGVDYVNYISAESSNLA